MVSMKERIHKSKDPLGGYLCLIPSPVCNASTRSGRCRLAGHRSGTWAYWHGKSTCHDCCNLRDTLLTVGRLVATGCATQAIRSARSQGKRLGCGGAQYPTLAIG